MYPDPEVSTFIVENFVPARAHVKTEGHVFERFNAQWTPTILVLDEKGREHHRIEGFLEAPDFLAQLRLGLAHLKRAKQDFAGARQIYDDIAGGNSDSAAEAVYWSGVSQYKGSGDAGALSATEASLRGRFPESTWAKKASIWRG